jgi:hypothetical protein
MINGIRSKTLFFDMVRVYGDLLLLDATNELCGGIGVCPARNRSPIRNKSTIYQVKAQENSVQPESKYSDANAEV